jgi:hypothetical protein
VIYERLARGHPTNEVLSGVTLRHMEEFGSAGLRTLCLAFRQLDPVEYDMWQERYIDAKTSLDDRQARVDEVRPASCRARAQESPSPTLARRRARGREVQRPGSP